MLAVAEIHRIARIDIELDIMLRAHSSVLPVSHGRAFPSRRRRPGPAPAQAIWLVPAPEFRRATLDHRGGPWTIAGRTSDPERAPRNLAERDRMFEAQQLGLHAIEVDTGTTEDDLVERVASAFGL